MNASFHTGNRKRLYEAMKPASLLVMFSGEDVRKTNDEYYPFYTDRNFYYLTGLDQHELVLMAVKEPSGNVHEQIYILPPDLMAERWTGARLKPAEVEALSGISDVRFVDQFQTDFHALAAGGHYSLTSGQIAQVYLDLFRVSPQDIDRPAHRLLKQIQANYPYLQVENANAILRRLRLIKQPCEIDAIRQAEKVTGEGIMAMMKASRPGMYEYQYKAEFDYALTQHGPQGPAFPSIISAGKNNFCIHYYSYRGQALEELGAPLTNMDFCTAYAGGIPTSDDFRSFGYFNATNGALWINTNGERMADETGADSHVKSETWANAPHNIVYTVFSSEMLIPDAKVFSTGAWGSVKEEFDPYVESLIEKGLAWKADTIEELAEKVGLPVDAFKATIAAYNDGCANGNDPFGRTKQEVAMANGPFYAVKTVPYVMITCGGPMMTKDCEVLNSDGLVIEGVYMAGEIVGMANVGGRNSIGGMGHGNCLVWGKKAAEVIAAKLGK